MEKVAVDTHEDPDSDIQEIVREQQQLRQQDYPPGFDLEEDDVSPEFANDPLFKLLKQLNTSVENGQDPAAAGMDFDPSALFASMPGMGNLGGPPPGAAGAGPTSSPQALGVTRSSLIADLSWTVIHIVSSLLLALRIGLHRGNVLLNEDGSVDAAASLGSPTKFLWYFATLELVLQSSRFFLEARLPPPPSKIASYASLLPQPFAGYIITGLRYIRIVRVIAQDFCILLFIAGVASLLH